MSNETLAAVIRSSDDGCDESKCVSRGLASYLGSLYDTPLTCYADNYLFPMACSDGYKPHIIDSEPVIWNELKWGTISHPLVPFHYFTCCQPDLLLPSYINFSRHCFDPIINSNNNNNNNETVDICENITKPYIRKMASVGPKESSMCCDSVSNNNTIFYLNDTECVPFQDKIYSPTVAKNRYGFLDKVSCDNNGIYIDFQYPRKIEKENNLYGIFYYECCKKESTQLPLYIQDSTFKSSIYPLMVVSAIAILLCVLLIVALLIPLFLNLNKKRERTTNANTTTSSNRTTTRTRSKNITRANRRQPNTTVPTYSGYVLYLIFLAFPDLIMNICILIKLGEFANQKVPNFNYLNSIQMGCSTANLYINCFISYEILNLLRNSNNIARCRPPSLIKVTLQAIVVYIWSIIVFVAYYFTQKIQIQARDAGNDEKRKILNTVNLIWSMIVSFVIPIIFFCHIWITIWHRGYITMSSVTGTMKELVCSLLFKYNVLNGLYYDPFQLCKY